MALSWSASEGSQRRVLLGISQGALQPIPPKLLAVGPRCLYFSGSPGYSKVHPGLRTTAMENEGEGEAACCVSLQWRSFQLQLWWGILQGAAKAMISTCPALMMDHLRLNITTSEKTSLSLFLGCLS